MLEAFVSFLIVFISGYFGGFLGTPGCVMATSLLPLRASYMQLRIRIDKTAIKS